MFNAIYCELNYYNLKFITKLSTHTEAPKIVFIIFKL